MTHDRKYNVYIIYTYYIYYVLGENIVYNHYTYYIGRVKLVKTITARNNYIMHGKSVLVQTPSGPPV